MPAITVERERFVSLVYAAEPEEVKPAIPDGAELDLRREKAYVSLTGYDVVGLKKWGIPIPISYPVIELRCYVRWNGQPGYHVVKKYVPYSPVAWLVTLLYGESCEKGVMKRDHTEEENQYRYLINLELDIHREKLRVIGRKPSKEPRDDSLESWALNRQCGVTPRNESYDVTQPDVELYRVEDFENTIAFEAFFGEEWAFLVEAEPSATVFADEMTVELGWPG